MTNCKYGSCSIVCVGSLQLSAVVAILLLMHSSLPHTLLGYLCWQLAKVCEQVRKQDAMQFWKSVVGLRRPKPRQKLVLIYHATSDARLLHRMYMISLRFLRIFAGFSTIQSTGLASSTPLKSISEHLVRAWQ